MIDSYLAEWFETKVVAHDAVSAAERVDDRVVRIFRKRYDPITVVPVTSPFLMREDVESVLAQSAPTLIVLVNADGHYAWDARMVAEDAGSSLQTFRELFTYLDDPDPRGGIDKRVSFVLDRLPQHVKVSTVEMQCEATMWIHRIGSLRSLQLAVEYHYEFTEEALVRALHRHSDVDVIYNANPNGKVTAEAHTHAGHAGVEVLGFGDLMGRLHRD